MKMDFNGEVPKFYGSVTVGERGQVAIPAEARRELAIEHSSKLLAFSGPGKNALILVKAESIAEAMIGFSTLLNNLENTLKADTEDNPI